MKKTVYVVGGGAAGVFFALVLQGLVKECEVHILEKTRQPLSKVRISGGGRCNVTHNCFDPKLLISRYPRGENFLKGPFTHFQPKQMVEWLERRGVKVKAEPDGRMFPMSDNSETIIECFLEEARKLGVQLHLEREVLKIENQEKGFSLFLKNGEELFADRVLLATGGLARSYALAESLGHKIVPPVPSLFTFNISDPRLEGLSGVSVSDARLCLVGEGIKSSGPLLITHWGVSGPAALRLSAWGARVLAEKKYYTQLQIDWTAGLKEHEVRESILNEKKALPQKTVSSTPLFNLPKNLWKKLTSYSGIMENKLWAHFSKEDLLKLVDTLQKSLMQIEGKSLYKDEFVTAGGVSLDEICSKTMESKKCKGLYFAGELIDVDGITGGFNFQNAWTTAWIAARAVAENLYLDPEKGP